MPDENPRGSVHDWGDVIGEHVIDDERVLLYGRKLTRAAHVLAVIGGRIIAHLEAEANAWDDDANQVFVGSLVIGDAYHRRGLGTAMAHALLGLYPGRRLGLTEAGCGNTDAGDAWCDAWELRFPALTNRVPAG